MKIRRKKYTKITKKRFDEVLALVNWSTRHFGADCYRMINPYGEVTNFRFYCRDGDINKPLYDLNIDEFSGMKPFGKTPESYESCGILSFHLEDCYLEVVDLSGKGEKWDYVGIIPIAKDNKVAVFITFSAPFIKDKAIKLCT